MSIEKMKLVRLTGPLGRLNETLLKILCADCFSLENANEVLPKTSGYTEVSSICPFDGPVRDIEEIARSIDDSLNEDELTNVFGTDREITERYITEMMKYLDESDFDQSDINRFLLGLKPQTTQYIELRAEYTAKTRVLTHRVEGLKHFAALGTDPSVLEKQIRALVNSGKSRVFFGFMPKTSMMKLYYYNDENKYTFKQVSADETNNWGIICTTETDDAKVKDVLDGLYFEEMEIPGSIDELKGDIVKYELELKTIGEAYDKISKFWKDNDESIRHDYSVLLDLQKVWQFRSMAAQKNGQFSLIGWVPKKQEKQAKKVLSDIKQIDFTIKDPEQSVTANNVSEPFPFESSIRDIEHIAREAGVELSQDKLSNILGTPRKVTDEYIALFSGYITGGDDDNSIPSSLRSEIADRSLKRHNLKKAEEEKIRYLHRLSHFESMDVEIDKLYKAEFVDVHIGRMSVYVAQKAESNDDKKNFAFQIFDKSDKTAWCVYAVPKQYASDVNKYFSDHGFYDYDFSAETGTVKQAIERTNNELKSIREKRGLISKFFHDNEKNILLSYSILLDLQKLWSERHGTYLKNNKLVTNLSMNKQEKHETEVLYKAFGGFDNIGTQNSDTKKKKLEPPTKLKNPLIFKPYEYFVEMYGVPKYGSIDITPLVAITYTVLFGVMFGDLGQGAAVAIIGLVMWLKKKSGLGRILIPCGCASMVGGLVFGSVFGYEHLLDPLYHKLGLAGKPVDVMESINGILIFAIFIGVALVVLAMLVNIYANLKQRQFGAALFDVNGLTGILLYLCIVNLVYAFMAKKTIVPTKVCIPIMVVCVIILFLKEILIGIVDKHDDWRPESVSDFIMQNIFELIEYILSYFSNTVSFLRVGAFVLVHAGMMMVVFSLAGANENIFVIILGNILITALEGLLSGIQGLRLEFYEMFSRCYEGGGKPFISARQSLIKK